MRKDVKLGLAVGGILFSAILVYVLFLAGGNKANNGQAGGTGGPDPTKDVASGSQTQQQIDGGAGAAKVEATDPAKVGAESIVIGGPSIRPAEVGTGSSPTTGNDPTAQSPGAPGADSTASAARGGAWDWRQALGNGASNDAIAHSVTPGEARSTERSGDTLGRGNSLATGNPTTPGAAKTYIVKPGDTLWSIAKAEYGSANFFPHLVRANPKVDPSRLKAGTKLNIPAKETVVPANAVAVLTPTTRPVDATKQYRVQAGDNLNTICRKLYGRIDVVGKMYQLNKDVIGPNPSVLKPNMVLQLPEAPSGTAGTIPAGGSLAGPLQ